MLGGVRGVEIPDSRVDLRLYFTQNTLVIDLGPFYTILVRNRGPWRCAITSTDVTYIVESAERVEQPSQTTSLHSPLARLAEA